MGCVGKSVTAQFYTEHELRDGGEVQGAGPGTRYIPLKYVSDSFNKL